MLAQFEERKRGHATSQLWNSRRFILHLAALRQCWLRWNAHITNGIGGGRIRPVTFVARQARNGANHVDHTLTPIN